MADDDEVEIAVARVSCWVDELSDGTWSTMVKFEGMSSQEQALALGAALRVILANHVDELPWGEGGKPKLDA